MTFSRTSIQIISARLGALTGAAALLLAVAFPGTVGADNGAMKHFEVTPTEAPALAALNAVVEAGIDDKVYPGAVLVVGTRDRILWAKPYGHLTYDENAQPMQLNTMFDLASLSKVVGTASAALLLLEDETLHLDDRAASYIAGFEAEGKEEVTVLDLMTHVSGLKAYDSRDAVEKLRQPDETHADALIRRYASLTPSYTPRQGYTYSCLNFQTLARITEEASGKRMGDLLRERVYGPLLMTDTTYVLSEEQIARTAPTIKREDGTELQGEVHDPLANYHGSVEHCPGNAGLFSTALDLARYAAMVLNEGELDGARVYKAETIEKATENQAPEAVDEKRGLGWDVYESDPYAAPDDAPRPAIGHTGYTGTLMWIDPATDRFVVFLTNRVYPDDSAESKKGISRVRKEVVSLVRAAKID